MIYLPIFNPVAFIQANPFLKSLLFVKHNAKYCGYIEKNVGTSTSLWEVTITGTVGVKTRIT